MLAGNFIVVSQKIIQEIFPVVTATIVDSPVKVNRWLTLLPCTDVVSRQVLEVGHGLHLFLIPLLLLPVVERSRSWFFILMPLPRRRLLGYGSWYLRGRC